MLETVANQTSQALVPIEQAPQHALISTEVPSLEQVQREAIVDLLLMGMYADQHISVIEQDVLAEELEKLGWDEFYSTSIYLQRAVPRVREAMLMPERTTRFLADISERLSDVAVMKFAIEKFSAMLCLDGSNDPESALIDQVMEVFFAAA